MLAKNTYDRSAALSGYGRGASSKQATRVPEEYEDLDIEEDEEEEIEERTPQVLDGICQSQWTVICRMLALVHRHAAAWEGSSPGLSNHQL